MLPGVDEEWEKARSTARREQALKQHVAACYYILVLSYYYY